MLSCLAELFTAAELQVTISLDERLNLPPINGVSVHTLNSTEPLRGGGMPESWYELARQADWTIVVAPEIDGVLRRVLAQLRRAGANLLNCADPFLRHAADKLQTAERLHACGLAHPPTIVLSELTDQWLHEQAGAGARTRGDSQWIVKPRDGAGGERLSLHRAHTAQDILAKFLPMHARPTDSALAEGFVVQPYLEGDAYSCSAIIDRSGGSRWLPLMTQEFTPDLQYRGGHLAPAAMQAHRPLRLLQQTVEALQAGAMGWIGVDLLYRRSQRDWIIIEVNPRCTTSIVELARVQPGGAGLGRALLAAYTGHDQPLTPEC